MLTSLLSHARRRLHEALREQLKRSEERILTRALEITEQHAANANDEQPDGSGEVCPDCGEDHGAQPNALSTRDLDAVTKLVHNFCQSRGYNPSTFVQIGARLISRYALAIARHSKGDYEKVTYTADRLRTINEHVIEAMRDRFYEIYPDRSAG